MTKTNNELSLLTSAVCAAADLNLQTNPITSSLPPGVHRIDSQGNWIQLNEERQNYYALQNKWCENLKHCRTATAPDIQIN